MLLLLISSQIDIFKQASTNDTGFYHLNVYSPAFSKNYSILFGIIVNTKPEASTNPTSSSVFLIVMAVTMGVLLLLSLIVIGFLLQKLKRQKGKHDAKGCM